MHCAGVRPLQERQVIVVRGSQGSWFCPSQAPPHVGPVPAHTTSRPDIIAAQDMDISVAGFSAAAGVPAATAVQHCGSSRRDLESLELLREQEGAQSERLHLTLFR